MIQDIGAGVYRNEYRPVPARPDDRIICCRGRELFVRYEDGQLTFLTYGEVTKSVPALTGQETYLFSVAGVRYYLFRAVRTGQLTGEDSGTRASRAADWMQADGGAEVFSESHFPGFSWEKINILRGAQPQEAAFAGVTGCQLADWYASRRFCPRCGRPMEHDAVERMMRCPTCGQMEYPKICPAVIVGVVDGDRLLLTKYAGRDYTHYALIAGFAEIGETIEETVMREVMEETGLRVKNLRYYKSQPWSFSGTLLFGFFAELDGDAAIRLDENELSEGRWCAREEIPADDGVSLTREMMRIFQERGREVLWRMEM